MTAVRLNYDVHSNVLSRFECALDEYGCKVNCERDSDLYNKQKRYYHDLITHGVIYDGLTIHIWLVRRICTKSRHSR